MAREQEYGNFGQARKLAVFASPYVQALLIALLGLLAYANSFHGSFVFDDENSIVNNPVVHGLNNFFSDGAGYSYNPRRFVGYLTFALNYQFSGLAVTGYHVFNLIVHVVNALLLFALVNQAFKTPLLRGSRLARRARTVAFLSAALFVVHPIQTQAVTYIVQRLTSLATMFYLLSLCLYGNGRLGLDAAGKLTGRTISLFLLSMLSMILAMKTKEIAFTLPVMLLLYEFIFFRTTLRKKLAILGPVLVLLAVIPLSMLNVQKPFGEILSDVATMTQAKPTVPRGEYLLTQISVVTTYARLLVWPTNQNLDYDYPINRSLLTPRVFISFVLLVSLLSLAIYLLARTRGWRLAAGSASSTPESAVGDHSLRLIAFGIFWFFIALLVESSLIPITDVIFEHRVYLPSVGAFIALGTGLTMLAESFFGGGAARTPLLLAVGIIVVLMFATYQRNKVWQDNVTLWQDVLSKSPGKIRGYNNLGAALADAGRPVEAVAVLRRGIALKPDHPEAYYNLGRILLNSGEFAQDAVRMFSLALLLKPDYYDAYVNLAAAYNSTGRYDATVRLLTPVMAAVAGRADAHFNLGVAYAGVGDLAAAERELSAVRGRDPGMGEDLVRFIRRKSTSGAMPPVKE